MAKNKRKQERDPTSAGGVPKSWVVISGLLVCTAIFIRRWYRWSDDTIAELRDWLTAGGANVRCVEPGIVPGTSVRGLVATCDIAAGDDILAVPGRFILSEDTADERVISHVQTELRNWRNDKGKEVMQRDITLAAALLREFALADNAKKKKGDAVSYFAKYLAMLPRTADLPNNFPVWDDLQRDALKAVMWEAVWKKDITMDLIRDVVKKNPRLFGNAGPEMQRRVLSLILSRQIGGMMPPWFDFANHALQPSAAHSCGSDTKCHLVAVRNLSKGEEITIRYGMKSNLELLIGYGFQLGTVNNRSTFTIDLDPKNATQCEEASKVPLDLDAALGLPQHAADCIEAAVGRPALLEAATTACKTLKQQLEVSASGIDRVLASGRKGLEEALSDLEERKGDPAKSATDTALITTLRREAAAVARCASANGR